MTKLVPQVRFKGFDAAWESKKLGELYKKNLEKNINKFGVERTISIATMRFKAEGNGANETSISTYKVLRKGDIAFEGHINKIHAFGRFVLNDIGDGIMSPRFTTLRPLHNGSIFYWKYAISSERTMGRILAKSTKLGTMMNELVFEDLAKKQIQVPDYDEQQQIGSLFQKLDTAIELQQKQLDAQQQFKKAMLQKMFPKKDAKVPDIRFAGFEDEWEEKKLGELGKLVSGIGFPENEQGGLSGIPFFKVSDMNNVGNEKEMQRANNYVSNKQIEDKKWNIISETSIIFAKVGAALLLNRKRLIKTPFLIDNNTMAYVFSKKWDVYFGYSIFETINLPKYAQIGALPSFNASDIGNISIQIPSLPEQQRIGSFFKSLDDQISELEAKLAQTKQFKQALLQKMFI